MGRTLKRVPLDFNWPLKKKWKGYVNPHYVACSDCDGKGSTYSAQFLMDWINLLLLAAEESAYDPKDIPELKRKGRIYPHPYLQGNPLCIRTREQLGSQLIEFAEKLTGEKLELNSFAYCTAGYRAYRRLLKVLDLDSEWGTCPTCKGEGIHPDFQKKHDAWESYHPPEGSGFQLWETTSEGSPVSPVFETLDALCKWCEDNATTFGSKKATKEQWKEMLDTDFVYHKEGNALFI